MTVLGVIFLIFHGFLKVFVKIYFFQKISLQEPSWTELGPTWVDFAVPNASKMGPETIKNDVTNMLEFNSNVDRNLTQKKSAA